MLRPLEMTERDAEIIIATKLLLASYYDIVRKNIQDLVPKSIMHFLVRLFLPLVSCVCTLLIYQSDFLDPLFLTLFPVHMNVYAIADVLQVNYTKRDLHFVFIQKLYKYVFNPGTLGPFMFITTICLVS